MNVGQVEGMQPRFATPGEDAVFKTREIGEKNPVYKDVSEKGRAMEEMVALVEEMQMYLERTNISLKFASYGKKGERISVIVADKETGEVIREIPPKELQQLYLKMTELNGILFDRKV